MKLYLGSHEPNWIGRSTVPLFVSMTRARRFGRRPALAGWALDSGGFTQLHQGGWTTPPGVYLEQVYDLADRCPGMEWAAPQDWMCEPTAREATGLSTIEHQHLTTENYLQLRSLDERGLVIPVLQGWEPGDHERHVGIYADAGVDLYAEPLVGIGSICRRQASSEIEGIVRSLADDGLRLHGFGVKSGGIARYADALTSADSLAWSYRARRAAGDGEPALCGGTHRCCNNCFRWAHAWYGRRLEAM